MILYVQYLQYIPLYEYASILGAKWFNTEWKPSRELVCAWGDDCFIPLTKDFFVKASQRRSCTTDPARMKTTWITLNCQNSVF